MTTKPTTLSLRTRSHVLGALLCASLATAGCSGDDDDAPPLDLGPRDGGSDLGPLDAGPETDAGPDVDAGPEADAGPETDAGPDVDAGPAQDAGPSAAGVSIAAFSAYSNCMPIVAPDPVIAFWDAVFTNSGSAPYTATITAATLTTTPTGGAATVSVITVDMMLVTVPPGGTTVNMRKASAVPPPPGACTTLCSGRAKLSLTFDLGGRMTTVESPEVDTGCVY